MMLRMLKKKLCLLLLLSISLGCQKHIDNYPDVQVTGAMREVMWNGALEGKIKLDTLSNDHFYGIGPLSYLKGEILLNNGKAYVGSVRSDSTMLVKVDAEASAPFFVYAQVNEWAKSSLPQSVTDQKSLESFLDKLTIDKKRPFAFKLVGAIESATVHLQNLPDGTKVSSPQEAHQGQIDYELENKEVEILGFFSTEHKGVFTHHDGFIHLHLITADKKMMGHVDQIELGTMQLLLPKK